MLRRVYIYICYICMLFVIYIIYIYIILYYIIYIYKRYAGTCSCLHINVKTNWLYKQKQLLNVYTKACSKEALENLPKGSAGTNSNAITSVIVNNSTAISYSSKVFRKTLFLVISWFYSHNHSGVVGVYVLINN